MARKMNRRRTHRRSYGGVAPTSHNDVGWSSKMSLGQGGDYLKYHVGQHGGAAALQGADLSSLGGEGLPSALRPSAMLGGLDKAFGEIQGLRDQSGGKRRKSHHKGRRSGKRRGGKRKTHQGSKRRGGKRKTHRRRRGGALAHSSFPSQGMLLDSSLDYSKAGLNRHWNDIETDAANARAAM